MKLCQEDLRLVRRSCGLQEVSQMAPLPQIEDDFSFQEIRSWKMEKIRELSETSSFASRIVDGILS